MSYGKKDEDADLGLVKVDRTQVFQEGTNRPLALSSIYTIYTIYTYISTMPGIADIVTTNVDVLY